MTAVVREKPILLADDDDDGAVIVVWLVAESESGNKFLATYFTISMMMMFELMLIHAVIQ
jgi:hypothetical protein